MVGRMMLFGPVSLAVLVAAFTSSIGSSRAERATNACITKPNTTAPQNSHWYYRFDRVANRRCWYLGPESMKMRASASPNRPASSRTSPQLPRQQSAEPIRIDAAKDRVAVASIHRPESTPSSAATAELAPMGITEGEQHSLTHAPEERSLILVNDSAAVDEPALLRSGANADHDNMLAWLVTLVALAIIVARRIRSFFAVRRLRLCRSRLRQQWTDSIGSREDVSATPARAAEGERVPCSHAGGNLALGRGRPQLSGLGKREREVEQRWRQLLHDRQPRAA